MADAPRYVGGQAVIDGVMMRGSRSWAVAARLPDGRVVTTVREAPAWAARFRQYPLLRGVATLGESLSLGMRALTWSADQQIAYEEEAERAERAAAGEVVETSTAAEPSGASKAAMRIAMVVGIVIFVGLFMIIPGVFSRWVTDSSASFNVVDGLVKFGLFLGYLAAIGLMPDIKRLFQYHGAEHKAIAAYENGVELTPTTAQQFTTEHVRCGTSFLLIVMVISILSHLLFGRPGILGIVLTRGVLLVVPIAAVSYEVIRFLAEHQRRRVVRWLSVPGLTLQRLTTREPTLDQLEVAITSLKSVLTADELAEVESRTRTVPDAWVRVREIAA